ncbi:hypothetical protein D9V60_00395 [Buchnera aphidicola (Aphis craccivora)]|uniref:Flagellar hook-length control protein FliK n=1 Tax=Buchnera aphidicola (Aphis craccivora) TaxID=466616 RepID=A0A4D6XMG8_9GAMM|nr:flagellar hook-length control protein FliK [Buchnera aphidicola]QCI16344.1 hypothetical protein D9V60_00395 [Buchnera aphidicola (Aphis craccivora)]QLL40486.1 hypothetical protein F3C69_00395 [Buchnera aphidicola (Aphis craccivore)]WAI17857.1 MAG: flagellar hook-length control protein FliK [Buchnera aphidicola (Aphis craccivora)]
MLSHLNNILLKKNILLNSNHNIYCDLTNFNFYESIVNECKQHLLNKEIKFDNTSTKQKKKNDENIISTNFIVNNLLNILNKKNMNNSFYVKKNDGIKNQKKKLDENIKLKSYAYLKNKEKFNLEENKKNYKTKNNGILKNSMDIKNKCILYGNYNIDNLSKKSCNKRTFNEISNLNIIKRKTNFIKNSKNFIHFKNCINNISNMIFSKNTHKNQYSICEVNSLKKTNENNFSKLNKKTMFILNKKENIQWKKAISQQVLFSISNKENKAEIRLQPEFLGSIYVKIQMKNDQAKLKFISDHIEIKNFLNNCIPFLRDSLNKNGIFLKKVNISNSFNLEKNKNLFISEYKPKISSIIKNFYKNFTQKKVIDMYV